MMNPSPITALCRRGRENSPIMPSLTLYVRGSRKSARSKTQEHIFSPLRCSPLPSLPHSGLLRPWSNNQPGLGVQPLGCRSQGVGTLERDRALQFNLGHHSDVESLLCLPPSLTPPLVSVVVPLLSVSLFKYVWLTIPSSCHLLFKACPCEEDLLLSWLYSK